MSTSAAFAFKSYTFSEVEMHMGQYTDRCPLTLSFTPTGTYDRETHSYLLRFCFTATQAETSIIKITCEAVFEFRQYIDLEEIPDYFYPNSLAIVFPYVRAFVSSVTLQANLKSHILIPTLNLTGLQSTLKDNTVAIN